MAQQCGENGVLWKTGHNSPRQCTRLFGNLRNPPASLGSSEVMEEGVMPESGHDIPILLPQGLTAGRFPHYK
jgi:hypothetical protein